jgi:tRNA(Arg) A34 adenosine deaminase TadA
MMMDQGLVMTEQTFMQRAVALLLEKMRANSGGPFGAVIVRNGTIISEGWNEVTSSNDPTAHSEIVAIRRACTVLGNFNLPGLRHLHELRTLPDVSRRDLLGAITARLFCKHADRRLEDRF